MQGLVRVVTLSLALCAFASANDLPSQSASARTFPAFESLDRNADQRLSRSEAGYDRLLSAIFADNDTDGDGFLTPAEYARASGTAPVKL